MIDPERLVSAEIYGLLFVLLLRLAVGFGYRGRTHRVWTFGVPTGAMVLFVLYVVARRDLELFGANDLAAVIAWGGLVVSQAVAAGYQWWPATMVRRRNGPA